MRISDAVVVVEYFIDDRLSVINTICNWRDAVVISTIMLAKEPEKRREHAENQNRCKLTNYKNIINKRKMHFLGRQTRRK